ncbi:IQ motif and SEC7 domain-containing protein 1-like isoform X2 [Paramacrobiotus metropolitanus]|uniref:IQ motif and SEC7 domain-containing protein 1-like isoform X2 n=1 Tax=Paramacrobiotus metropolitanus TaxID=2943436 RepID=UPI002445C0CE|nr:IQ motif and SEC7 domain-containing protein 1-like isoform X2 [Paramacrobiotus metropolitanus]
MFSEQSCANMGTLNVKCDTKPPICCDSIQMRKKSSAEGIPRSRTADNGQWINKNGVLVPLHPAAGTAAPVRPKSAFLDQYPVHPVFNFSIGVNRNDNHPTAAGVIRRRYSREYRSAVYELSQDLQDKQLELLEKKYGGRLRSRHAALVIQRAYRRYSMQKKFDRLSSNTTTTHHSQSPSAKLHYAVKTKSACDAEHVTMNGHAATAEIYHSARSKLGMTRSCSSSATARIAVVQPQSRMIDLSPSIGVYDNVPAVRGRKDAPASRPIVIDSTQSKLITHIVRTDQDGVRRSLRTEIHTRSHVQSISPVRGGQSVLPPLSAMSSVSICDEPSPPGFAAVSAVHDLANTSPVWKRLDELTDQDSGVGSSGQLSHPSPLHTAFLDYDNVVKFVNTSGESSTDGPLGTSLPNSSLLQQGSPSRRKSDVSRASNMERTKTQRRAVSASRVPIQPKISETRRKRQYRVGLNLFNKKPERGMEYLIEKGFVVESPSAVARFLISRKGLSKQKIGEYLGCQTDFCIAVLQCFAGEVDLCGLEIDQALRKFQTYFRLPGEAQKIERVMEVFSDRYLSCNPKTEKIFGDSLTVLRMAYGIILLNTDLHNPSIKKERKMKLEDFLKNMRGALGDKSGVDEQILRDIYVRIKAEEFKPGNDHVSQVQRVDKQIIGDNKPVLPVPHRRLVCFCRLYEVYDENKKERAHQREVFLFNDLMVVTKQNGARKKNSPIIYRCRTSFPLLRTKVQLFSTPQHPNGLKLVNTLNQKTLIMLNARNEHDRDKFVEDLRESIMEMDEMEVIRIESELEKQQFAGITRGAENRDSGVADVDDCKSNSSASSMTPDQNVAKRTVLLSSSLLDVTEQQTLRHVPVVRRLSTGSLDSGMCMPGSSTASTQSTPSSDGPIPPSKMTKPSLFGSFFTRKSGKYQM